MRFAWKRASACGFQGTKPLARDAAGRDRIEVDAVGHDLPPGRLDALMRYCVEMCDAPGNAKPPM